MSTAVIYDAVVIGGGPAGSSAANVLATNGWNVLVLERERFPRFHVGESLLPACRPLFERLGVAQEIDDAGFVIKRGASFLFEDGSAGGEVVFSRGLDCDLETAYQVPRAQLDELLLKAAERRGAAVRFGARAREVDFESERVLVEVESPSEEPNGADEAVAARYLVDASGQSGFLSKRMQLRRVHPGLRNVALYAHYEGVELDPEVPEGDIQVVSLEGLGWIWMIPLSDTLTSVGLVTPMEAVQGLDGDAKRAELESVLDRVVVTSRQMKSARRVTEIRVEADFSYSCKRYRGDRWLLAGDAGSFLDPVFSTGVQLALEAGVAAGEAISGCLQFETAGTGRRVARIITDHLDRYDRLQRQRYEHFERWVRRFYRPEFRDLLCQPTERYGIVDGVATVLAGERELSPRVHLSAVILGIAERIHRIHPVTRRLHQSPAKSEGHDAGPAG